MEKIEVFKNSPEALLYDPRLHVVTIIGCFIVFIRFKYTFACCELPGALYGEGQGARLIINK